MKSFLSVLPILGLCSAAIGCGLDSGSSYQWKDGSIPNAHPTDASPPPQSAPPIPASNYEIPRDARVFSVQFFVSVRLMNEQKTEEFITSRNLKPKAWNDVYRAISTIDVGTMLPDSLEISFPLPPEVATPVDSDVALLYGCGGGRVADFYFIRPLPLDLSFSVVNGMPRGVISADRLKPLFEVCDASSVSIALKFYKSGGEVVAWEQFYITRNSKETGPLRPAGQTGVPLRSE